MEIKPLNECITVELITYKKTDSGLELPAKEEDKSLRVGKVLALPTFGSELYNEIKIGDIVVFGEYAFDSLMYEGQVFNFVKFEDILGVIK